MVLAIPFFVLVAALVAVGLSQTSTALHGSQSTPSGLYGALTATGQLILGLLAKFLRAVSSRVASANLPHLTAFFGSLATLISGTYRSMVALSEATNHALIRVFDSIDGKVATKTAGIAKTAKSAAKTATHANKAAAANHKDLTHYKAHTTPRVNHATKAVDVAIPNDIASLRARNKALERQQQKTASDVRSLEDGAVKTFEWLRSHPLAGVTGVFAGAVAVALSRLGFGFLRCRSWQNLGRSLKCSDANIIGDLLGLATGLLAASISLEEFIRAAQAVEGEAVDALHTFIRE